MYRKLASVVLVASAINAKYVYALGLGEMTMHSALNEPLNAEIKLKNVGDLDSSQIIVKMASEDQFSNAGVDRTFFLSNIRFTIQVDGEGNGVIKLNSNKRVNEPYLDFLVEAKWPTGRVLRSYTALVDLPVYSEAAVSTVDLGTPNANPITQAEANAVLGVTPETQQTSAPVSAPAAPVEKPAAEEPETSAPAPAVEAEPVAPAPVASTPVKQAPAKKEYVYSRQPVDDTSYATERGDTLWEIASKNKPADDVTVQQVMIAINRQNPEAFIGGNINRLKAGMILQLPSAEDVYEISRQQAVSEVRTHNQGTSLAPQIDATQEQESSNVEALAETEGHLSLAASGSSDVNGSGSVTDGSLSAAEEAALEGENQSLNRQVGSLSNQVNQLERLLEIKEQQLAELQTKLGEDAQQEEQSQLEAQAPVEVVEAEVVEVTETVEVSAAGDDAVLIEETVVEEVVVEEVVETEAQEAPKVPKEQQPVVQEKSFVDTLIETPMILGGVALALMALLAGLFIRKRNQSEQEALSSLDDFEFDAEEEAIESVSEEEAVAETDSVESFDDVVVDEVDAKESAEPEAAQEETTAQTGDAIGEADIYIAYGRFDQASELLQNALAQSPGDVAVRSKLLEVYAQSGNQDEFVREYSILEQQGEAEAVTAAKELLITVEGGSTWLDGVDASDSAPAAEEISLDSGDDTLSLDDLEADSAESLDSLAGDLDLDSALDGDLDLDAALEDTSEEVSLDLDLGELDGDDLDLDAALEDSTGLDEVSDLDDASSLDDIDLDLGGAIDETVDEVVDTLDSAADDLSLDLSAELDESDVSLDLSEAAEDVSTELGGELDRELGGDLESELDSGLDSDLDAGLDVSLDTDLDLSLDSDLDSDLDTDLDLSLDAEEPAGVAEEAPAAEEESLDLGDIDLGIEDATDSVEEVDESLDLSLGDEIDLSAPEESVEDVEDLSAADAPAVSTETEEAAAAESIQETPVSDAELTSLDDDDLSFLTDEDEISTKLDLARAYVEMGDADGAKDILAEVVDEGNDAQKSEAESMLGELG